MKKLNYVKLTLDLLMGITFALLFNKQVLGGLTFHEIAGTIIGGAFLTHILLNWRWVKNVTLQLFDRKLPAITRFGYALNVLLLISMTTIMVSGVFISKILFPSMHIGDQMWFKIAHISLSFMTLITVGIHIGLHWKWVISVCSRIVPFAKTKAWGGYAAKLAAVLLLLFGAYEMNATSFGQRVASTANLLGSGTIQMGGEGGRPPFAAEGQRQGTQAAQGTQGTQASPSSQGTQGQPSRAGGEEGGRAVRGAEGMQRGPEGGARGRSANAFQVLATYFGIMSVFVIVTYYLEKRWSRRKRAVKLEA
ncbi:DUF4405 domain-containing protein [Paenibacillus rigui]|uniref:Flavinylation-associated cytochrome domain-containing protein n=1 Tax=Paenibacillus rigui TaxID=554312 RepID=A0A229UM01_9BACL|nr:DUF4405 domain-containing protein [Paenibacillus rigui]OXM84497.1 hypothetical protein CF651_20300 [Paenibacillus rigui]